MLVDLQSVLYGFHFRRVCALIPCPLNTCLSSGSDESVEVLRFLPFCAHLILVVSLGLSLCKLCNLAVCSGCGFLQLVYTVHWLWLLVTLSASVVGIWSDMILLFRRFMNTLLLFTILGNLMAASSVGISACSFGKFLGSMPKFLYPSLPVPDVVAPS